MVVCKLTIFLVVFLDFLFLAALKLYNRMNINKIVTSLPSSKLNRNPFVNYIVHKTQACKNNCNGCSRGRGKNFLKQCASQWRHLSEYDKTPYKCAAMNATKNKKCRSAGRKQPEMVDLSCNIAPERRRSLRSTCNHNCCKPIAFF